jgi:hypothetical protein
MANCNSFVTAFGTRAMRMRLLKQRQFSQIRTHLACTRIRRMALAASDDDQQKVKRYSEVRSRQFHREELCFRRFPIRTLPTGNALAVGHLVMS